MLENKKHKKMSLSGKSLLMGTLSTAAIVLSASTVMLLLILILLIMLMLVKLPQ